MLQDRHPPVEGIDSGGQVLAPLLGKAKLYLGYLMAKSAHFGEQFRYVECRHRIPLAGFSG